MIIGGFQKFSLIDYPGHLSAIIFTQGCNMRCPYCHNPELVDPNYFGETIDPVEIIKFLKNRIGRLDGLVITGGEPTIQNDLPDFLNKIKKLGYMIKLDTNGSRPEVIENLLNQKLIDYLAMDVKAPLRKYQEVSDSQVEPSLVRQSIKIIMESGRPYEFRTTIVLGQLDRQDIFDIGLEIQGAEKYVLQSFSGDKQILNKRKISLQSYDKSELREWADFLKQNYVKRCLIR